MYVYFAHGIGWKNSGRIALWREIVLCGERSHGQYSPQKEMRILPEFVLVYLFEGSGIYQDANHETIELAAGSCLLIPPKLPYTYHPHSPDEQETSGCDQRAI